MDELRVRVWDVGLRVWVLEIRVGFRVQGSGAKDHVMSFRL